jgi:hypothetical protein
MHNANFVYAAHRIVASVFAFWLSVPVAGVHAQTTPTVTCPKEIHVTEEFTLTGSNLDQPPVAIHITFPSSPVVLPNGVVLSEIILAPSNISLGSIKSKAIKSISSMGAVDTQNVEISVSTLNGKLHSEPCTAVLLNEARIVGGSPYMTPNQLFMVTGWDFGQAGTLHVHFPVASAVSFSSSDPNDVHDLDVPIPSPSSNSWKRFAIMLKLPPVIGVVPQMVEISFVTADGRVSNSYQMPFQPTIALISVPRGVGISGTCSNAGFYNMCTTGESLYLCFTNNIPLDGIPNVDMAGIHAACWGIGSTEGTDTYTIEVKNGWWLDYVDFSPTMPNDPAYTNNGSVNAVTGIGMSNYPNPYTYQVPFYIGATGGMVMYAGNFIVNGPKGVPY